MTGAEGSIPGRVACKMSHAIYNVAKTQKNLLQYSQYVFSLLPFVGKWKSKPLSHILWLFVTPWTIYSLWNSLGQNTGVGSLSLSQGIFPTSGSNPGLPHCRQILYQLSHRGSPRILEWVAYPFSMGSSWPRNWTRVSCIAGRFLTNWAMREALWCMCIYLLLILSNDAISTFLCIFNSHH